MSSAVSQPHAPAKAAQAHVASTVVKARLRA